MKIILREDIKNLGAMGEMVEVKNGYARNFLLPKKFAVVADLKNMKALAHEKKTIEERAKKLRAAAMSKAEKLSALTLTIKAKAGEEEKLFGSVTSMDIEDALKAAGFEVDRKKIVLDEPIKRLGSYKVKVKVHHDVSSDVTVNVVPE